MFIDNFQLLTKLGIYFTGRIDKYQTPNAKTEFFDLSINIHTPVIFNYLRSASFILHMVTKSEKRVNLCSRYVSDYETFDGFAKFSDFHSPPDP